jgi:hypothetical protein
MIRRGLPRASSGGRLSPRSFEGSRFDSRPIRGMGRAVHAKLVSSGAEAVTMCCFDLPRAANRRAMQPPLRGPGLCDYGGGSPRCLARSVSPKE